jgi:tetratricopeptide (TPR) repeat protein
MPDGWVLIVAAFGLGFALIAAPMLLAVRLRKDRWAGRQVFLKYSGTQYGHREPDGTFVPAGTFDSPVVHVAERQGDWLCAWPPGSGAWFPLSHSLPLEEAPDYFSNRLRAHPEDSHAWTYRGIAWDVLGQADRALADYDEALRLAPEDFGTLLNRANLLTARQEHDRAIADYTAALRLYPEAATVVYNRGRAWALRQVYDKAVADYTEAIRLAPTWSTAYYGRALTWSALKEHDKAIDDSTEAIRLAPQDPAAYSLRGQTWLLKMEQGRAGADLDDAIRLGSTNPADYAGRAGIWLVRGDYDRAEADCTAALRLASDHAHAFFLRGIARSEMKNVLKKRLLAPADFEMAARQTPEGATRCLCKALSWIEQKEHGKALAELAKAQRLEPDNDFVLLTLAGLHASCPEAAYRDGAKAVAYATRGCELTGWKFPHLLGVLAMAHAEAGDFVKAVDLQRQVLAVPDLPEARRAEALRQLALYERGQPYRS